MNTLVKNFLSLRLSNKQILKTTIANLSSGCLSSSGSWFLSIIGLENVLLFFSYNLLRIIILSGSSIFRWSACRSSVSTSKMVYSRLFHNSAIAAGSGLKTKQAAAKRMIKTGKGRIIPAVNYRAFNNH